MKRRLSQLLVAVTATVAALGATSALASARPVGDRVTTSKVQYSAPTSGRTAPVPTHTVSGGAAGTITAKEHGSW